MHITSVSNPKIKQAIALRDRKSREAAGRFLIDGIREITLACRQPTIQLTDFFVCDDRLDETSSATFALAESRGLSDDQCFHVTPAVMDKLAYGERDLALMAVARTWSLELSTLTLPQNPLILVLEDVEKPGNLGAILRTADASGVSAIIVSGAGADPFNPNTIRASQGAVFTIPIAQASSATAIDWLKERGVTIFAARVDGAINYTSANFSKPTAIALGSEALGLSKAFHSTNSTAITIPMLGQVDSLNVSVTAAIITYEAIRQRQQ